LDYFHWRRDGNLKNLDWLLASKRVIRKVIIDCLGRRDGACDKGADADSDWKKNFSKGEPTECFLRVR